MCGFLPQLNDAQLSYSSVGGRFPHRPPGASAPSCFPLPGRGLLPPQRLSYPGSLPTLYHPRTPADSGFGGGAALKVSSVPDPAGKAVQQGQAAQAASMAEAADSSKRLASEAAGSGGGGGGGDTLPGQRSSWASNAPGVAARDATPVPRTPATPEAAPRAHPAAAARPPASGPAAASRGAASTPAAMAAAVFSTGQRPIYRCNGWAA